MKKILCVCLVLLFFGVKAQKNVGIGTTNPEKSAILELNSSTKGFLMPRMSLFERNSIPNPAKGLLIFQNDNNSGYYFFNGDAWKPLTENEAKSITLDPNDWSFAGNVPPPGSFIGTTGSSSEPLRFRVSGEWAGFVNAGDRTFFGLWAGRNSTGSSNSAFGSQALSTNVTGTNNTAVGASSLAASTGNQNTAVGAFSLTTNGIGESNTAIGFNSLRNNTDGAYNVAIGGSALNANTLGQYNLGVGFAALLTNIAGTHNMGLGAEALRFSTGSFNTAIGTWAGRGSSSYAGSNNVFIGYSAGSEESGSNKLYIASSNTTMPLVYGDFSAKYVTIGDVSPTLRAQGTATGGYNLLVKGGILTEKIKVALAAPGTDWADYVFEPSYKAKMLTLNEVEKYTLLHKHLPNVPSAEEMVKTGLDVSTVSKMFMEKIEELTLYMIELDKEVKALKAEKKALKSTIEK